MGSAVGRTLFSDAEGAEDQVEDVVGGSGSGEGVERMKCFVEVEEDHLVGDALYCGLLSFGEGCDGSDYGLLLAQVGDEGGLCAGDGRGDLRQNGLT